MELTAEQVAIINSTGDIKINAVAGSGKTTTIIEYASTRPARREIHPDQVLEEELRWFD